jgi:hypothetical protein
MLIISPRGMLDLVARSLCQNLEREAVVFEDFFAGLCMPLHLVLVDILRKF